MSYSPLEIMCIVLDILHAYRRSCLSEGGEFLWPIKKFCWGEGRIIVLNPRNGTVQLCKKKMNQRELIELSQNTVTPFRSIYTCSLQSWIANGRHSNPSSNTHTRTN